MLRRFWGDFFDNFASFDSVCRSENDQFEHLYVCRYLRIDQKMKDWENSQYVKKLENIRVFNEKQDFVAFLILRVFEKVLREWRSENFYANLSYKHHQLHALKLTGITWLKIPIKKYLNIIFLKICQIVPKCFQFPPEKLRKSTQV